MANFDLTRLLAKDNGGKIILLVLDGLGGLPMEPGGPTELEAASTPNMDRLAQEGTTGMSIPIARGVEPGSGPGHLALFGYDPLRYSIGRGALEAAGIGLDLRPGDVAARGNFATIDENGLIVDRRAGRISTEKGAEAVADLKKIVLPGVETIVEEVKEHRFVLLMRGEGLDPRVEETDPLEVGKPPLKCEPEPAARRSSPPSTPRTSSTSSSLRPPSGLSRTTPPTSSTCAGSPATRRCPSSRMCTS